MTIIEKVVVSVMKLLVILVCAEFVFAFCAVPRSLGGSSSAARGMTRIMRMEIEQATFGMGCFWAPQKLFDGKDGVVSTKVGYTGGTNDKPSYSSVCAGDGHIEAVLVDFDNELISYEILLDEFYTQDKQTLMGQQGQYQSAIWCHSEEQMEKAQTRGDNGGLTVIQEKAPFYVAEEYHQDYEKKQPVRILWLLTGFTIDIIPNLPKDVYKVGAAMTFCYILLFLYERFVQPSVQGRLQKI